MEITGRVTADAEVRTTKNNKQVVSFTVVVNDYVKPKEGEGKEFEEYFHCAYWLSTKVADHLLKGSIVTVSGRMYLNEYTGKDGNKYAQLAFHANAIKIIAKAGKRQATNAQPVADTATAGKPETKDDLPF
jgi:single-strand DNA-binding protein